jgi:hypothetical protein
LEDCLAQFFRRTNCQLFLKQRYFLSVDKFHYRILRSSPCNSVELNDTQLSGQTLISFLNILSLHVFLHRVEMHTCEVIIKLQVWHYRLFERKRPDPVFKFNTFLVVLDLVAQLSTVFRHHVDTAVLYQTALSHWSYIHR